MVVSCDSRVPYALLLNVASRTCAQTMLQPHTHTHIHKRTHTHGQSTIGRRRTLFTRDLMAFMRPKKRNECNLRASARWIRYGRSKLLML
jgi:hypothetical protein